MLQIGLIEDKSGIMALLDEECALPKGAELNFVGKLHDAFDKHALYTKPKRSAKNSSKSLLVDAASQELQFIVTHYAGDVTYTATHWLDKNKGAINQDVSFLMQQSKSALLAEVFRPVDDPPSLQSHQSSSKALGVSGKGRGS